MALDQSELLVILICSCAVVGMVVIMHARGKRLLDHVERMKALEMGRDLPPEASSPKNHDGRSPFRTCYSIAGNVTFWGCVFAVGAGSSAQGGEGTAIAIAIAAATGAIGVTSVICGTILAAKKPSAPLPSAYVSTTVKGYYDPDGV